MKRARAGSISGRLRSASDLEEKGLIDKSQKGVLKDLIISGDAELQTALDQYDDGDATRLEGKSAPLYSLRTFVDMWHNLLFGLVQVLALFYSWQLFFEQYRRYFGILGFDQFAC